MENSTKRREWVKSAAIVFLTILLLLTFFSNTISKRFLPEVSSVAVTDGSITAKVRASGKVTARGNNNVKAEGTRTIAAVKVKEGQEVNEGDILFVMGEAASDELEAAETARDSAYYSYRRAQASYPVGSNAYGAVERAYNAYMSAVDEANIAEAQWRQAEGNIDLIIAKKEMDDAEAAYYSAVAEGDAYRAMRFELYTQLLISYPLPEDRTPEIELQMAQYLEESTAVTGDETYAQNNYNIKSSKYFALLASCNYSDYKAAYESALAKANSAESAYYSMLDSYNSSAASMGQSYTLAGITEEEAQHTYSKAQEKVDNLTGVGEDIYVKAKVSGTVESINFSAGDKVVKDDVMCVIEVPDMGYQMTCSVTKDQAGRLKVGDTASASNYYWGKEILATISSIKTDPSSPQAKKIITFDIEGDVTAGQELTFSVGQKSASYDIIVPKSAVMSDNNGSFVLTITSKSNALGNRYFAKRVGVEILAEDDTYKAISGDLGYGDFVITGSSTKISSGDQVRLADNG